MENSYGIGITNRYALFLDDELDPYEKLQISEQEKELKKKTKVPTEKENKGKPDVPVKAKPVQPPKKVIKDVPHKAQENKREDGKPNQRSNDTKPERTFNKFNNENREERNNRRNREDRPFNGGSFENNRDREDRPRREGGGGGGDRSGGAGGASGDNFESRRGGRSVGNKTAGRGAPRRQFDDRRGKREFDRQSGSDKTHGYRGVKPIDKRDGGGAHNWGSHKDVIEEADATKANESDPTWGDTEKPDPANTTTDSKEGETETETAPTEEEPKELTLDEWKAQRAGRAKPTYNLRKAGEGEDLTQWKKMYELNKKKAGEEEDSDDDEYDTSEYPQRVGRQKHVVGIDFLFNDASRRGGPGRGRGTRPGGRGGRPQREPRAGPGGEPKGPTARFRAEEPREERVDSARNAPKVDDERDFPSLG